MANFCKTESSLQKFHLVEINARAETFSNVRFLEISFHSTNLSFDERYAFTSAKTFFDKVPNNPVSFVWLVFMKKYTTEAAVNGH